ncbi:hypothetical protein BGZ61DRAFT_470133 [Ilyonectria robusta]|uniref:uncharacterized protein n=1 Tax=Ilyonectria robusta TaxID=1079257 RepID=UPI001E8DD753|nr:uncharacterized protein BGZ61DRAFT_470133 [Ilyonectria robusta]KAH8645868.1 hypothetical protein BGZ61DRAFT_470133 [Ilyonectria robusta]
MAPPPLVLTALPCPPDQILLGSLVPDRRYPNRDAEHKIEVEESVKSARGFQWRTIEAFNDKDSSTTTASFKAALTKLFSASASLSSSPNKLEILPEEGSSGLQFSEYSLVQPRALFRELCAFGEVRELLENGYKYNVPWYFVVGYRTLVNARVIMRENRSTEAKIKVTMPVSVVAGAPVPDDTTDIGIEAQFNSSRDQNTTFMARGEQVFAVAYRRVELSFFKGEDGRRRASLANDDCWISVKGARGAGAAPEDDEFVEAGFGDAINDEHDVCIQFRDDLFVELASP